jgi:hypothetical protein
VIIVSLGIGGDAASAQRGRGLSAGDSCDNNCFGLGIVLAWVGAEFRISSHPVHFSLVGKGEPVAKVLGAWRNFGWGESEGVEA